MKKIIIVLGMHRSGTSALTRSLPLLGAELGTDLMPALEGDNDKGFWEDLSINGINERLLSKTGSSWHALSDINASDLLTDRFDEERSDAIRILHEKTKNTSIFAFKDPRTANLLPFWQNIFAELNFDDSYIIAIRNPISVADSLLKRNGFPHEKSFFLWMKHYYNALRYTRGKVSVVVDYDQLLETPVFQLNRVANKLSLPEPDPNDDDFQSYVNDFLTLNLRHNNHKTVKCLSQELPKVVVDLFLILSQAAGAQEVSLQSLIESKEWKSVSKKYHKNNDLYVYLDKIEKENIEVSREVLHLTGELELVTEELKLIKHKLTVFDQSLTGCVFRNIDNIFSLCKLRPSRISTYNQIIAEGKNSINE